MAFQGDASAVMTAEGGVNAGTVVDVALGQPKVNVADARRVRIALGIMLVIALADCILYLPRVF